MHCVKMCLILEIIVNGEDIMSEENIEKATDNVEKASESKEKVLRAYNGTYYPGNYLRAKKAYNGSWRVSTERLNFRFMGFGKFEVDIYYDDIESMQLVSPGYYFVVLKSDYASRGRTTCEQDCCFVGISIFKVKEAEAIIKDKIGESRLLPRSKKYLSSFIVPIAFLVVVFGILIFGMIAG